MKIYDAVIIGAGSAGLGCLGMAKRMGWSSVIIDKDEANIGGDCLNYGCVPSKALIHVAKYFYGAKNAQRFGLKVEGKANWTDVISYVHDKQAVIRAHESADYLRASGENLLIGEAKFIDSKTVEVNGEQIVGDKIFICTGSHPRFIPFDGIDEVEHYSNETLFYDLHELPERFLVVGGGPIGCEMAQVFQRLGSQVTILERGDRILGKEREEISEILTKQLEKEGIQIIHQHSLTKFLGANTAILNHKETNEESSIEFDACLMAIGRGLNHKSLNVEAAGIQQTDRGRIIVDDYLQTTTKNIFVVGDAAGMYQFSHGAEKHVKLLEYNFEHLFDKKHTVKGLSWVTFTDPEIATFGFSESYLQEHGIDYWRQDQSFHKDDRAITAEYEYGHISLYVTKEKNKLKRKVLGGSIICPAAGEIMQELHLASLIDITLGQFMNKVYAYPTASRINQQTIQGIIEYKE